MKAKRYSRREFMELLGENGYRLVRHGKGSHDIYGKEGRTVAVPKEINHMLALRIIKECGLVA